MKIKTLLIFNVVFSLIILFLIGLVVFWSQLQENDAREKEIKVNLIVKDVVELRGLAYEYSMHHEERAVVQWNTEIDELKKRIADIEFENPEQKEILERISRDFEGIESAFSELVAIRERQTPADLNTSRYQQHEDRLVSLLLLKVQLIVLDALKLADASNVIMDIANESHRIIVIFTMILSTVTISISVMIIRSIVQPLSKLHEGTEIIGSGNLDHRVDIRSYDEINQLSDAFNQMTAKLQERTSHLESAIMELEGFAYSASHDLRSPLRGIDGFSQAFLEEYSGNLDETGKGYLKRVRLAAQKMSDIIDSMLNLSRITRKEMHFQSVDLSALARTIAGNLRKIQPERKAEFIIAEGLTARGDPQMLEIVLENLLGNAWKFTGRHPAARIEFGAAQVERKKTYFVSDDGAGFDMTYVDKLFKPFERQHTEAEFPGIGIGLATVQRIIHRHGGEVWGEGAVEKGATFYFTLAGEDK